MKPQQMMDLKGLKEFDDLTEEVLEAFESMAGVKDCKLDTNGRGIQYRKQKPDNEKIQKLYKNPKARPMIDKFFELSKFDKAKYGLTS